MVEMGGPGVVVQALGPAAAADLQVRALGGKVRASRRDPETAQILAPGRVERALCQIPAGLYSVRRVDRGYPNGAERLRLLAVRRRDHGPVACWAFRRVRPPRERRQEEMSGLSRQAEGVG
jgi:hypothetical protein